MFTETGIINEINYYNPAIEASRKTLSK